MIRKETTNMMLGTWLTRPQASRCHAAPIQSSLNTRIPVALKGAVCPFTVESSKHQTPCCSERCHVSLHRDQRRGAPRHDCLGQVPHHVGPSSGLHARRLSRPLYVALSVGDAPRPLYVALVLVGDAAVYE